MTINLNIPDIRELKPRITVFGVGGAGGNAVNNMISAGLQGVEFVVANTDAQALTMSKAERIIQMGVQVTAGLGAGSQPDVGRAAAEEVIDEIRDHLTGAHMVFVTAGMGGGTGTGAAPVVARVAKELGILTVGVVTKPFHFEGQRRMRFAETGITELQKVVDTLLIIPNQNLFRVANEKTTFADAFAMADQVLYSGVACITDLMVKEGLINLDFADVRSVMREMGKAMMGTGEASGDRRAIEAAEAAIANPLLDETTMKGARGLLISITGGKDLTLFEVDEAATRIREEVDPDANIILGATFEESLEGVIRVSVVATGIEAEAVDAATDQRLAELKTRLRGTPQPAASQSAIHAVTQAVAQPAPVRAPAQRPAAAPPQQARSPDAGITIAPLDPGQMAYGHGEIDGEHRQAPAEPEIPGEAPFIPPEPEAPARIPRVEDFPPVVQRQIEAKQRGARPEHEDRGPMSLLRRLAGVGLGRREEEPAQREPQLKRPLQRPQQQSRQVPPQPRVAQPAPRQQPQQEGLYRPRQGELDQHGRPLPAANRPQIDDELEIPAFLRRQAN